MKYIYQILLAASLTVISCDESRRGSDSDEAAVESDTHKAEKKKRRDADFVRTLVAAHYGELKLAELANQRSRTPEIKKIAQATLEDHASSLNELKRLAKAREFPIPVEEPEEAKQALRDIADESGRAFDLEWVSEMLENYEKSIKRFEERAEDTDDAELKAFIAKTLPVLKRQRESLQTCKQFLETGS